MSIHCIALLAIFLTLVIGLIVALAVMKSTHSAIENRHNHLLLMKFRDSVLKEARPENPTSEIGEHIKYKDRDYEI